VELERKVYDVLAYLIQHRDRLVTKDELLDQLWPGQVMGEAALTRCITSIRKTLGDDGNRQEFIKTQYGRGYRFVGKVVSSQHSGASSQQDATQTAAGNGDLASSAQIATGLFQRWAHGGSDYCPVADFWSVCHRLALSLHFWKV
jgi:DNA-binding winged helix-turn-helix (wHTH) protein